MRAVDRRSTAKQPLRERLREAVTRADFACARATRASKEVRQPEELSDGGDRHEADEFDFTPAEAQSDSDALGVPDARAIGDDSASDVQEELRVRFKIERPPSADLAYLDSEAAILAGAVLRAVLRALVVLFARRGELIGDHDLGERIRVAVHDVGLRVEVALEHVHAERLAAGW